MIRIGTMTVDIDEVAQRVTTTLPDGRRLVAEPIYDEECGQRALSLGYGSEGANAIWEMTREHDLAHCLLAHALGQDRPRVLDAVAGGRPISAADADLEERVVLLLQRVSNVGLRGAV